jgi:hypothetical protein
MWAGLAFQAFAVDLTPRYIDTFIDGISFHRLFFLDGDQKIGLSIGRETTVEQGGGGVVFQFPKFPDASLLLKHSPLTPDQPFEGLGLDRYREAAHRMLPPGVTGIKATEETASPITINRWRSFRFVFLYDASGTMEKRSVTFLSLNADDQLVLVTTAHELDFPEAADRSWQIIRSWQPFLPGDEKPPKGN